jgi:hypothetical protein
MNWMLAEVPKRSWIAVAAVSVFKIIMIFKKILIEKTVLSACDFWLPIGA